MITAMFGVSWPHSGWSTMCRHLLMYAVACCALCALHLCYHQVLTSTSFRGSLRWNPLRASSTGTRQPWCKSQTLDAQRPNPCA